MAKDGPAAPPPLIVLADDNRDAREMYALYLNMVGYRVETAEDGHEALIKVRAFRPDLIVLDLAMPKLDGWAAMRELQRDAVTSQIPIVVLTGHDLKAHLKHAVLAAGAVSYLTKPCLPQQLALEVGVRLAGRPARAAGMP